MPFSEDAEKGVLCSLLLSPKEVSGLCAEHLLPEAFYIRAHEIIYGLILELGDKSRPIDFVFLKQALKNRNQLEEIGGPEYLNDLYNFVPTAANAAYYIDTVLEKYVLRWSI
jgi:replicative DNA helicase